MVPNSTNRHIYLAALRFSSTCFELNTLKQNQNYNVFETLKDLPLFVHVTINTADVTTFYLNFIALDFAVLGTAKSDAKKLRY